VLPPSEFAPFLFLVPFETFFFLTLHTQKTPNLLGIAQPTLFSPQTRVFFRPPPAITPKPLKPTFSTNTFLQRPASVCRAQQQIPLCFFFRSHRFLRVSPPSLFSCFRSFLACFGIYPPHFCSRFCFLPVLFLCFCISFFQNTFLTSFSTWWNHFFTPFTRLPVLSFFHLGCSFSKWVFFLLVQFMAILGPLR